MTQCLSSVSFRFKTLLWKRVQAWFNLSMLRNLFHLTVFVWSWSVLSLGGKGTEISQTNAAIFPRQDFQRPSHQLVQSFTGLGGHRFAVLTYLKINYTFEHTGTCRCGHNFWDIFFHPGKTQIAHSVPSVVPKDKKDWGNCLFWRPDWCFRSGSSLILRRTCSLTWMGVQQLFCNVELLTPKKETPNQAWAWNGRKHFFNICRGIKVTANCAWVLFSSTKSKCCCCCAAVELVCRQLARQDKLGRSWWNWTWDVSACNEAWCVLSLVFREILNGRKGC